MAITLVQGSPKHRVYLIGSWVVAAVVLVALPYIKLPEAFGNPTGQMLNWNKVLAYAVAILGLNLVIGYSGQISLGHSAFVGLGAYATVLLVEDHHWSFFAVLPVAFAVPFLVGCVVGLPALRIKGLYLVVVTFALAITFPTIILRFTSITGGSNGKNVSGTLEPPSWTPFDPRERVDPHRYRYYVLLLVAVVMFVLARNIIRSRMGRALVAQRDNPIAASISGVSVPVNKVLVFGLSAGFCGIAGWMLIVNLPFASDVSFSVALSITLIIGLVMGGGATVSGAIPGAVLVVILSYLLENLTDSEKVGPISMKWLATRQGKGGIVGIAFGVLLLLFVFVLPGGVIDGFRRLRSKLITVVPRPSWLQELDRPLSTPAQSNQHVSGSETVPRGGNSSDETPKSVQHP
jgi:branched-chain amino acid transport system permease protein